VPLSELGVPRGTDLRKTFALGTAVTAKVLENAEGKLKLSLRGAADDAERAQFEAVRGGQPKSLGTLGDLFKNLKK
jgi:small subunit ribosomal protein S1